MSKQSLLCIAAMVVLAFGCGSPEKSDETVDSSAGISIENMDARADPANDFFRYVNGSWLDKSEIPGDQGSWGSFNELREFTNDKVLEVLKSAAEGDKYADGTDQRKAADFFSVGMDSTLAEQSGMEPIKPILEEIDQISNALDLQKYHAKRQIYGGGGFFGFAVFPDLRNSKQMSTYLTSGGLGLPDRDYYFNEDDKSVETRDTYVRHIARVLTLTGASEEEANDTAGKVMAIETDLAKVTLTKEARRNIDTLYNKMSMAEIASMAPSVDWNIFMNDLGVGDVENLIVMEPLFIAGVEKIINNYPLDDIKAYLKWQVTNDASPFLSNEFVASNFDFYSKQLRGVEEMRPRWKRVLASTNFALGEAIGKLYVDEVFPPEAKEKAQNMVENIKLAYADRIKGLEWMSDSTKEMALKKLKTMQVKIGYPDKWTDYGTLDVTRDTEGSSYAQNVWNARKFVYDRQLEKLGKPVDKTEWQMSPQTVNAYYNPLFNEIVFPAAILQPPFYDYKADEAVNYGGIGAVIGHEISHGFDDQGSRFDEEGNLKNWWTEEDLTQFRARTQKLIDQFDAYEPLDDVHVNGQFTLGENIGDLGGINAAYDGLQRHLSENGRPDNIDGFTAEQRFFISWGTIWRIKYKDETLRTQVQTDPHSPGMYRATGPLANMPEFYEAFGVKEGDGMWRSDTARVQIW
ncbi:MAG: M13 family metallopeptidase [Bacteroidota bacterium]